MTNVNLDLNAMVRMQSSFGKQPDPLVYEEASDLAIHVGHDLLAHVGETRKGGRP